MLSHQYSLALNTPETPKKIKHFLDEVYESSDSVIYLAPIIFDAKSLDE